MTRFLVAAVSIIVLCSTLYAQSGRRKPVAIPTPTPAGQPAETPKPEAPKSPPVTAERNQDYRCTDDGTLAHLIDDPATVKGFEPKEVETRAAVVERPEARYTQEARRNGVQGRVVLKLLLGPDGQIDRIRVIRRLPFGLTENAIKAACGIKFKPAVKDGHPVAQWLNMEYGFSLAKSSIFGP